MAKVLTTPQLAHQALSAAWDCLQTVPMTYAGKDHLAESLTALEALVSLVEGLAIQNRAGPSPC